MGILDQLTGYLGSAGNIINLVVIIVTVIIAATAVIFIAIRVLKYKHPVEIWDFDDGRLVISQDMAALNKKNGIDHIKIKGLRLTQLNNFRPYQIKMGLLKKTRQKYYLTRENGALKDLTLAKYSYFFDENGRFLNPDEVFFEDDTGYVPLTEAELYTKDGAQVYSQKVPTLAPANNDSQNAFALTLIEKVEKLKIPTWFDKAAPFFLLAAGIGAGVIVFIINKAA